MFLLWVIKQSRLTRFRCIERIQNCNVLKSDICVYTKISTPCGHAIVTLYCYLLSPRLIPDDGWTICILLYQSRYNNICVRAGHKYTTKSIRIMCFPPSLISVCMPVPVRCRVLQKCRYRPSPSIGRRRRDAHAKARARARTPEEDKWLKEIVYQNGFDFYVYYYTYPRC